MIQILTDSLHKIAYATDASVYREIPYGVAYPKNVEDLCQLISQARHRKTNIIARAGGTSIAGQVVGNGIVADISRYFNHIIEINAAERYAWVEPGVVRDELNIACEPYGLFFSPETSTSNRCCIGGMTGNNSCGTHSLIYGSTRRHILEAEGVLADGTIEHFAEYSVSQLETRFGKKFWERAKDNSSASLIERIYSQLIGFALDLPTRRIIVSSYPDKSLTRRSCGYAIDEVIEDLCNLQKPLQERTINLCRLIAGSEGTLVFLTKIKVSLDPLPAKQVMVVCAHCNTLDAAFDANLVALRHSPEAVELMDGEILRLSKTNLSVERFFVEGDPAALLITELRSDSLDDLNRKADDLEKDLLQNGLATVCTRVYAGDVSKVWNLRKAGLGILGGMRSDAKPTGVIEDTAVMPSRLKAYISDISQMLNKYNLSCVYYGHISTGELHLRPILNLKSAEDRLLFRELARETTLIVRRHRGTISGEHGDGRLRGEFIPLLYGEQAYQLMRQVKYCWDKDGIFNPHKIVDTPLMDSSLRATESSPQQSALLCQVEQCNGSADCRKSAVIGGTMCPTYKLSHDELQSTRARANILREFLAHKDEPMSPVDTVQLREVLLSCLACKACKRECPSGVDMTHLRALALQYIYSKEGMPLRTWLVAHNADIQRLGSFVPHLYNFFATNRLTSSVLKKMAGFAKETSIPPIAVRNPLKRKSDFAAVQQQSGLPKRRSVFLFLDEFTRYQEPHLADTFILLLNRLGYEVVTAEYTESGRAAISKGHLKLARRYAEKNVRLFKDKVSADMPLVGIEPSCILTFRDEYPDLVPSELRTAAIELGNHCLLFDEFLMQETERGNIRREQFSRMPVEIWLHGHCHQKALVGTEKTAALLSLPENAVVHTIQSGCCGMAGSFGYEKEHYKTSIEIGEMLLFPAVRQAVENGTAERPALIAAPGISCRTHILRGTGIKAQHPIEILYKLLT